MKDNIELSDQRRGQGILDERHYRELSTDLHQMQLAFEGQGLGGNYFVLARHFEKRDFFPEGDERKNFSQFPNLVRFFFFVQMLYIVDKIPFEERITQWKITAKNTSFSAYYDYVESEFNKKE